MLLATRNSTGNTLHHSLTISRNIFVSFVFYINGYNLTLPTAPEVCKARSLDAVEALLTALPPTDIDASQPPIDIADTQESLPDLADTEELLPGLTDTQESLPTSSRPAPRKKSGKQKGHKGQVWKPAKEFAHLPFGMPSFINDPTTLRFTPPPPSPPLGTPISLPEVSAGTVVPTQEANISLSNTIPAPPTLPTIPAPPAPPTLPTIPTPPADSALVATHVNNILPVPTPPVDSAPAVTHVNAIFPVPTPPTDSPPTATHDNVIVPTPAPQIDPRLIELSNGAAAAPSITSFPPPAFPLSSAPTPFVPRTVKMSNFPDWLRKSGKYLLGLNGGLLWNTLLDAFFDHESSLGFETGVRISNLF